MPSYSYVLTVGKEADDGTGRLVTGADYTAIQAALDSIPNVYSNNTCSARYLVKIMPGVYRERVTMKPCVDIEGSGELTTQITATGGSILDAASATLTGASNAELRYLAVKNTGGAAYAYAIAIYNKEVLPRITHVKATAWGASNSNYGVANFGSSPTMTNVTAEVVGASARGVHSEGIKYETYTKLSHPKMTNVDATSVGGTGGYGVSVGAGSTAEIHHSNIYRISTDGTVLVGASRIEGGVTGSGTAKCVASYNGDFLELSATCQ